MRQKMEVLSIFSIITTTKVIISKTQKMTCEVSPHKRGEWIYD